MSNQTVEKLHIKETVNFAIDNIPQVDKATLEKFVELVNLTGNYGEISHEQLLSKMCLALKYIPNACANSLLILADLLDIPTPIMAEDYHTLLPFNPHLHLTGMIVQSSYTPAYLSNHH
jgi:hypothetical protein